MDPNLLLHSLNRYIEAVLTHCGYRLDQHAGAGLWIERLAEPMLAKGSLDREELDRISVGPRRTGGKSSRVARSCVAQYKVWFRTWSAPLQESISARQERETHGGPGLHPRAPGDPLTLEEVAKVSVCQLLLEFFRQDKALTFAHHVQRLRIERAKQMLKGNILGVDGIRKALSSKHAHFHHVFKLATGLTPADYRERGG